MTDALNVKQMLESVEPYAQALTSVTVPSNVILETLEYVREQEQPRIMRLPEAMSKYDPVLAEFKNCNGDTFTKWVDAVISPDLRHVTVTDLYCEEPESRKLDLGFNLYNRMFRFWTGKPTDEQRNAEPWQTV